MEHAAEYAVGLLVLGVIVGLAIRGYLRKRARGAGSKGSDYDQYQY